MNLRHLEVFRAVMTAGSATRAAELLHISQPAVSQLIAQLERQSGLDLFTRRGSRMSPTWEAKTLFAEVDKAFIGVERLERVVTGLRDHNWGHISIASFPGMVGRLLPTILSAYCQRHREVEVALEVRRARDLAEMLLMRQVDLAVTLTPSERQEVSSSLIGTAASVCILPVGHRLEHQKIIHARDLEGEEFISLGRHDRWRQAVDKVFADLQVSRRMRIETAQTEAACSFVGNGFGVSVVDPMSLYHLQNAAVVVRKFEPSVLFELWLLRPQGMVQSKLVEDVARFVRRELRNFLQTGRCAGR